MRRSKNPLETNYQALKAENAKRVGIGLAWMCVAHIDWSSLYKKTSQIPKSLKNNFTVS